MHCYSLQLFQNKFQFKENDFSFYQVGIKISNYFSHLYGKYFNLIIKEELSLQTLIFEQCEEKECILKLPFLFMHFCHVQPSFKKSEQCVS